MPERSKRGGSRAGAGSPPNLTKTADQLARQVRWLHAKPDALSQTELQLQALRLQTIVNDLRRLIAAGEE